MSKKKEQTDNTKGEQEENGEYGKASIYLALQGNNWPEHQALLLAAIDKAKEENVPLYVVNQSGAPKDPPICVPGMPNYPNCNG